MTDQPVVPPCEWEWHTKVGTYGVHTRDGLLTWWFKPAPETGRTDEVQRGQRYRHFLRHGPAIDGVPEWIETEIRGILSHALGEEA